MNANWSRKVLETHSHLMYFKVFSWASMFTVTGLCNNRDVRVKVSSHLGSVELSIKVSVKCVYIILQLHPEQTQKQKQALSMNLEEESLILTLAAPSACPWHFLKASFLFLCCSCTKRKQVPNKTNSFKATAINRNYCFITSQKRLQPDSIIPPLKTGPFYDFVLLHLGRKRLLLFRHPNYSRNTVRCVKIWRIKLPWITINKAKRGKKYTLKMEYLKVSTNTEIIWAIFPSFNDWRRSAACSWSSTKIRIQEEIIETIGLPHRITSRATLSEDPYCDPVSFICTVLHPGEQMPH